MTAVRYRINPPVDNDALNALFAMSWPHHKPIDFTPELIHCLLYVYAYVDDTLIGFVKLAWDGGIHTFILDTTVHPDYRRRGIGVQLVQTAVEAAREHDIEWVHVDYNPEHHTFYAQCGFRPTLAGLINLKRSSP